MQIDSDCGIGGFGGNKFWTPAKQKKKCKYLKFDTIWWMTWLLLCRSLSSLRPLQLNPSKSFRCGDFRPLKVLADIVESIAGAVIFDSGHSADRVWEVLHDFIFLPTSWNRYYHAIFVSWGAGTLAFLRTTVESRHTLAASCVSWR